MDNEEKPDLREKRGLIVIMKPLLMAVAVLVVLLLIALDGPGASFNYNLF